MSELRDIVRRHVEKETLRDLYGDDISKVDEEEKEKKLEFARRRGLIDEEVDKIINAFLGDELKPKRKKRLVYTGISFVITVLTGVSVNNESWLFLGLVGILYLLVYGFFVFMDDTAY